MIQLYCFVSTYMLMLLKVNKMQIVTTTSEAETDHIIDIVIVY